MIASIDSSRSRERPSTQKDLTRGTEQEFRHGVKQCDRPVTHMKKNSLKRQVVNDLYQSYQIH